MASKLTPTDVGDLVTGYLAGESLQSLAQRHGRSIGTVWRHLRLAGVQLRDPGSGRRGKGLRHDADRIALLAAYALDTPMSELITRFKMSKNSILRIVKEEGVDRRHRRYDWLDVTQVATLYQQGETIDGIALQFGVTYRAIIKRLVEAGIELRPDKWMPADIEAFLALYSSGESELALSRQYGVSRTVIQRTLIQLDISRRGSSEANLIRAARLTPEQRRSQARAANEAMRGVPVSLARKRLTAQSKEINQSGIMPTEMLVAGWLRERGLAVIHQRAIGPYNADLAIDSVAVEVNRTSRLYGNKAAICTESERTRYILDSGWNMVFIWTDGRRRHPLTEGAADYVITFLEQSRRNPTVRGQYRVIWGNGEEVATSSPYFYKVAPIPSLSTGNRTRTTDDSTSGEA